jgi:hypothetical protein
VPPRLGAASVEPSAQRGPRVVCDDLFGLAAIAHDEIDGANHAQVVTPHEWLERVDLATFEPPQRLRFVDVVHAKTYS